MLSFRYKIEILKKHLLDLESNFADSYKTDILLYLDDFNIRNKKLYFLNKLHSEDDIINWVNFLTSKIVMKFNSEEEQLSDFIYYSTN